MGKLMRVKKAKDAKAGGSKSAQALPFMTNLGQHILKNSGVVKAIVEKSALKSSDIVLEVGPGTGNLTKRLLEQAKRVVAFEIDHRMVAELEKRVQGTHLRDKLEIHQGDVMKGDWPHFDVCVSNLPYQISSPFIFRLLLQRPLPRFAVLMVQKEFADRLIARPGDREYSRLSVNAQLLAKVEHLMNVKRTEFRPPPQVDSAVVRIEPKNPPPNICYPEWEGMLRLAFLRKNKTLSSIFHQKQIIELLKQNYEAIAKAQKKNIPEDLDMKAHIESTLAESGLGQSRARSMTIEDFLKLLLAFNKNGIHFHV